MRAAPVLLVSLLAAATLAGCLDPEEAGTAFDDVQQETPVVGSATAENDYVDTILVTEATTRLSAIVDLTDKSTTLNDTESRPTGPITATVELLTPQGEPLATRRVEIETAEGVPLTMETAPGDLDDVPFPQGVSQRAIFRVSVDRGAVGVNGLLRAYAG